jgi:hypothetical protein
MESIDFMKYHPNSNKRNRLIRKYISQILRKRYSNGIPPPEKIEMKKIIRPYELTIVRPSGALISLKPLPPENPIKGGNDKIVIYAGTLPIDALTYLYSE